MSNSKKILAWVLMSILSLPCILIMNCNGDATYLNYIGIAYAYVLYKLAPIVLPKWMIDYFNYHIDE
jgi:hypothetical protein